MYTLKIVLSCNPPPTYYHRRAALLGIDLKNRESSAITGTNFRFVSRMATNVSRMAIPWRLIWCC